MAKHSNDYLKTVFGDTSVGQRMTPTVKVTMIYTHPPGHPLRHVRMDDRFDPKRNEKDQGLVDSIVREGFRTNEPILVRLESIEDTWQPALVYGSRRYRAALIAQDLMRKTNSPHLDKDGDLKIAIKEFKGSDIELLLARQEEDAQPLKQPHTLRVLCAVVAQMGSLNVEAERIVAVMPRSWFAHGEKDALKIVEAVTSMWHTVKDNELLRRLEHDDLPPGLLPAILSASPKKRMDVLELLLEAGVTSVSGAARALERAARAADNDEAEREVTAEEDGDSPDIEDDGLDSMPESGEVSEKPVAERATAPRAATKTARTTKPRIKAPIERTNAATVKRIVAAVEKRETVKDSVRAFAAGAGCGLGRSFAKEHVVNTLAALPAIARAAIAGMLFREGLFDAKIQELLDPQVIALVKDVSTPKARKKAVAQ